MDEDDEHEPESLFPTEPVTERVRIVGAEPAGSLSGEVPAQPDDGAFDDGAFAPGPADHGPADRGPADHGASEAAVPVLAEPVPAAPELPHWTEPPTGQVPAVLDRRSEEDDEAWAAADSGPVWREHQHEWEDDGFEPAMLADEWTRVGALEETPVEERRPWEFDDLTLSTGEHARVSPDADEHAGTAPAEHTTPWSAAPDPAPTAPSSGASWWDEGAAEEPSPSPVSPTDVMTPEATPARPAPEPSGVPSSAVTPLQAPSPTESAVPAASASPSLRTVPPPDASVPAPAVHPRVAPRPRPRTGGRTPPRGPAAPSGRRSVPVAVATGVGIAAAALICFKLGTVASLVIATVVVTLAAAECFAAFRRGGMRPATLLGLVATVAVMVSAYAKGTAALPLVMVLVVVTSMVWYLVGAERGSPVQGISATVLGFAWTGLLGSFAALLLAPSIYPARHGIAFLLGAVVATVGEDVGALVFGSWLGRHQLAPHVSPNKTWEGTVGGAVLAVVLSVVITGRVHPWTPGKAAILGVVVAVIAPIGDLCESLIKRDLGLKDMGSLLPGHGGVLDRVDALLFVLPATYYLVRVLNLG